MSASWCPLGCPEIISAGKAPREIATPSTTWRCPASAAIEIPDSAPKTIARATHSRLRNEIRFITLFLMWWRSSRYSCTRLSRSEFVTTDAELKLIAAAHILLVQLPDCLVRKDVDENTGFVFLIF